MKTGAFGYPILSADQTRAMDVSSAAEYGLPTAVLMENAGRAVADVVSALPGKVFVAAGSGNNGGDALVAARILLARGRDVTVGITKPLDALDGLCALNARRYRDAGGLIVDAAAVDWTRADVIVEGLLGTGLSGAPREPVAGVIQAINGAGKTVVSVDVPSGVNSDECTAPALAIRATRTVALACYKPALVHFPAAEWAGEVILADIGFPKPVYPAAGEEVLSGAFVRRVLPTWEKNSHKGKRGSLLVVAGSRGMAGAATMACNSAVYSGSGLVYLACPATMTPVMERKVTEAIVRPVDSDGLPRFTLASVEPVLALMANAGAIVLGPGLSQSDDVADFVEALLPRITRPLLLDADALNVIASRGLMPPPGSVLTPHPGEMARLLNTTVAAVQSDRVAAARGAAERFGCVVVLKGAHTVIAAPGHPAVVNTMSHNVLATGGSGDVLCGVIGTLLAQGLPAMHAALAGVRWHGTMGVLAASKWGGTVGAATMLKLLPRAREVMLAYDEIEVLV